MASTGLAGDKRSGNLVVTLTAATAHELVDLAREVASLADGFEVRLDYLKDGGSPVRWAALGLPAIATCRPPREGGRYLGTEATRLERLRRAAQEGAAWVDVEWDVVEALGDLPVPRIVSRHLFDETPADVLALWEEMAARGGDVVKVATRARSLTDALRVCSLYTQVDRPTIAIAMGEPGIVTRILAFAFPVAFLSYAAPTPDRAAAPGQLTAQVMLADYAVDRLRTGVPYYGYLAPDAARGGVVAKVNRIWRARRVPAVLVPLPLTPQDNVGVTLDLVWRLGFQAVWMPEAVGRRAGVSLASEGGWVYPNGRIRSGPIDALEPTRPSGGDYGHTQGSGDA